MATHSNILAWKIPRTEEPGRPQSICLKELGTTDINFMVQNCTVQKQIFVKYEKKKSQQITGPLAFLHMDITR